MTFVFSHKTLNNNPLKKKTKLVFQISCYQIVAGILIPSATHFINPLKARCPAHSALWVTLANLAVFHLLPETLAKYYP
jgi:hypothetical protein